MNKSLLIKTKTLKDLLSLFGPNETLIDLSFGDTWHPSSGFIDEMVFKEKPLVGDILEFDYDFRGLIGFSANISSVSVKLLSNQPREESCESYKVTAGEAQLRKLKNRIIEKNAYTPNSYNVEHVSTV